MKLEEEAGITESSLHNAKLLIEQHGLPIELHFCANTKQADYSIEAKWPSGRRHTFTGFAWGYGGTGPAGLVQFLELAQISSLMVDEIPIDRYGKTSASWFRDPNKVTASL